jgi:hypothetical protein
MTILSFFLRSVMGHEMASLAGAKQNGVVGRPLCEHLARRPIVQMTMTRHDPDSILGKT